MIPEPCGLLPSTLTCLSVFLLARAGHIRVSAGSCSAADRAFGAQRFSGGRTGRSDGAALRAAFGRFRAGIEFPGLDLGFQGLGYDSEVSGQSPVRQSRNSEAQSHFNLQPYLGPYNLRCFWWVEPKTLVNYDA